ncbi:MAG: urate hydroxylase PuuD [Gammaproteobacteria bacterium]|nr:urate hydroxylase PuuD [Gammaproteobacteria bacterium]MBU1488225.1 urate hydroxylase PuuD [Gammaproteobacteria bacterium]MBU2066458.1 urate hydroxylase PuuD [Gammaproteobacteria bacterium]MBU2139177.1 urate hydroxylase PuuD [Gammaproteobacteria bacterium]MBU2217572.1 urate hydroxylase PuuD [Gammaproteobacteria bacterium]
MHAHYLEWLNLSVRWIHMITGIAWIGASFYFVWLENNLNRANPRDGLSGDLWAIHGGGIYHLEKYKLAPPAMPENLHWFKWEAYFTWLSGVALLMVVYYLNPGLYLVKPGSELAPALAVCIGLGSLLLGWLIYDLLCDSPLGQRPALLGAVLFVLIIAAAWGFSQIFSGRAAYIHVGAIIGTLMVGNVFRIIMPAQRALVKAINDGTTPDPSLPAKGLLRSRHNNYFTLPVLFIMISNHFPSTYGSDYNWLILAGIAVLAVLVRHYFNTRHATQKYAWTLPAAALGMLCLAFVTDPSRNAAERPAAPPASISQPASSASAAPQSTAPTRISFAQVQPVITERCSVCHAAQPSSPMFSAAPAGFMLDTPQLIQQHAAQIKAQAVDSQIMPLGNLTQMTPEERTLIGAWIDQGAKLD